MVQYKVMESHALPRFDPTKTVRDVVFTPANACIFTRVSRQYATPFAICYFLGVTMFPIVLFAPVCVGQYVALAEMLLELPVCLGSLLTLRTDLIKLIVVSYDYWFFASAMILLTVSFSLVVHDLRVILIASRLVTFQVPMLIDANVSRTKRVVFAIVVNIVLTLIALGAVSLDAIPGMISAGEHASGSTKRSLSVRDLLANALMTMLILMLRIVFRKYSLLSSMKITPTPTVSGKSTVTMKCVMLRCLLKLHDVRPIAPRRFGAQHQLLDSTHSRQLRHTSSDRVYESTDIVAPSLLQVYLSPGVCKLFHAVGTMGIVLTFACGGLMMILNQLRPSPLLTTVTTGAFASTGGYVGILFFFSNRQLLLSVCLSFDFLFVSLQITFAHACICDMFAWRPIPSAITACMSIWFQWVLTLDALTPDIKQHLRFSHSRRIALVFLVVYLISQSIFLLTGFLADMWPLENRAVVTLDFLGKHLEFRVLPFFVSRMLTVLAWTGRLIWRFGSQNDPYTLIMLRGQVEFDYEHSTRPSIFIRLKSILPLPGTQTTVGMASETTSESVTGKQ